MLDQLEFTSRLFEGTKLLGVEIDDVVVQRFWEYSLFLSEYNESVNLTRIPESDYLTLHFLDSLTLAGVINSTGSLIDVGTGAGFPGLPLKIIYPALRVVLVDSTRKKLVFLEALLERLNLTDVELKHARAEQLPKETQRRFDFVTARAVAPLERLVPWLVPLMKPAGKAIALKGKQVEDELENLAPILKKEGAKLSTILDVPLPFTDIVRKLIVLERVRRPNAR